MELCTWSVHRRFLSCARHACTAGVRALKVPVGWATPVVSTVRERFGEVGSLCDIGKVPGGREESKRLGNQNLQYSNETGKKGEFICDEMGFRRGLQETSLCSTHYAWIRFLQRSVLF